MGITDEAYGDALIKQQAFVAQQMKEKQMSGLMNSLGNLIGAGQQQALNSNGLSNSAYAQQQAALAQQAGSITYTGTQPATWATNPTTGTFTPTGVKVIDEQDLQHDAMKAPLSALVDMWTMRWQGEWVSEDIFQEDTFWRLALIRLVGANRLEKHHLANQYAAVYRIIE